MQARRKLILTQIYQHSGLTLHLTLYNPGKLLSLTMGTATKIFSVIFRLGELVSAVIVLAIVGRFLHLLNLGNGSIESRIIYAEVMAAISTVFSIFLVIPAMYSFWAFPLDFALFVCWLVCFGLLAGVSAKILPTFCYIPIAET